MLQLTASDMLFILNLQANTCTTKSVIESLEENYTLVSPFDWT